MKSLVLLATLALVARLHASYLDGYPGGYPSYGYRAPLPAYSTGYYKSPYGESGTGYGLDPYGTPGLSGYGTSPYGNGIRYGGYNGYQSLIGGGGYIPQYPGYNDNGLDSGYTPSSYGGIGGMGGLGAVGGLGGLGGLGGVGGYRALGGYNPAGAGLSGYNRMGGFGGYKREANLAEDAPTQFRSLAEPTKQKLN